METVNGGIPTGKDSSAAAFQPLSMPLRPLSIANDDSEEWEYEYSGTETETYYLTLDLTNPSIPCAESKVPTAGRGGQKSIWINPSLGRNKRQLGRAPTYSIQKGASKAPLSTPTPTPAPGPIREESIDPEEPEEEDDMQDAADSLHVDTVEDMVGVELEGPDAEGVPDEIQILDLHSDNPIVSWRGHNFSCSWAENIGTELLFAFRDQDDPLPILRALMDDVDLLAASSARLISTSVTLRSKKQLSNELREHYGTLRPKSNVILKRKTEGFMIPVGREAGEPRKEQASFLERLMEIKKMKGEQDEVTINAQRRLHPAGWKMLVSEKRDEERRELRSALIRGGEEGRIALTRLEEMDREDEAKAAEERQKRELQAGRKKSGRKFKEDGGDTPQRRSSESVIIRRPRGSRGRSRQPADLTFLNMPSGGVRNGLQRVLSQSMLSTPTPKRWAEIGDNSPLEQPDDSHLPEA